MVCRLFVGYVVQTTANCSYKLIEESLTEQGHKHINDVLKGHGVFIELLVIMQQISVAMYLKRFRVYIFLVEEGRQVDMNLLF